MKNTSRSRLLLSGVLSLAISLSACSKSSGTATTAASNATQVSAEFCIQIGVVGATKASSKGASVMTVKYDDLTTRGPSKMILKRAGNGNMSLSDEPSVNYDEKTMTDAEQRRVEASDAAYVAYMDGYVEGLRNDQWVRYGKGAADYPETSIKEFFDVVDRSEWFSGSSSWISVAAANALEVQVVSEAELCKYSFKDTDFNYTIVIGPEKRLRSFEMRLLDGSVGTETSFEYSPVDVEIPSIADLAPDSVVAVLVARNKEIAQSGNE